MIRILRAVGVVRLIGECEEIRWWEGVAYCRETDRRAVLAPIGLHRLIAVVRQSWFDYKMETRQPHALERAYADGYRAGQQVLEERAVETRVRLRLDDEVARFVRLMARAEVIRPFDHRGRR